MSMDEPNDVLFSLANKCKDELKRCFPKLRLEVVWADDRIVEVPVLRAYWAMWLEQNDEWLLTAYYEENHLMVAFRYKQPLRTYVPASDVYVISYNDPEIIGHLKTDLSYQILERTWEPYTVPRDVRQRWEKMNR